jgi:hypothetical protein
VIKKDCCLTAASFFEVSIFYSISPHIKLRCSPMLQVIVPLHGSSSPSPLDVSLQEGIIIIIIIIVIIIIVITIIIITIIIFSYYSSARRAPPARP